jgi:hypothetical protein
VGYGFVALGIVSAALFGVAPPLGKLLLRGLSQFQLAGFLCLGAGIAMLPFVIVRRRAGRCIRVDAKNALWLAAAVLAGGCPGPVLLLLGLTSARASSVSLWLNLELAATAVLGSCSSAIALMLRARHAHLHHHEPVAHVHAHRHDDLHHDHPHPVGSAGPVHSHDHVHVPDLHYRHAHGGSRKEGLR